MASQPTNAGDLPLPCPIQRYIPKTMEHTQPTSQGKGKDKEDDNNKQEEYSQSDLENMSIDELLPLAKKENDKEVIDHMKNKLKSEGLWEESEPLPKKQKDIPK